MILQATKHLNIDLEASWMVGDKAIDVEAGLVAGVECLLVQAGYGVIDMQKVGEDVSIFASLIEAAKYIKRLRAESCIS